jgi:hypothetical protein
MFQRCVLPPSSGQELFIALMMEGACDIPESCHPHTFLCENLKSHIVGVYTMLDSGRVNNAP